MKKKRVFELEERFSNPVTIGSDKGTDVVLAGRVCEKHNSHNIYFDGSDNFVVLDVGKRGSGKSYGMGAILEGFATDDDSAVARHTNRRAVVLLDPLDVHWPAMIPLSPEGPAELQKQHAVLADWGDLQVENVNIEVFFPAGEQRDTDPTGFCEYRIPVCEMSAADWALLLKTDLLTDTRGRLLDEAYRKVTELGWQESSDDPVHNPSTDYGLADLIACIEGDYEIRDVYHNETKRSVLQPLKSYQRMPLFGSTTGTPMVEIAQAGKMSILSLGRLSEDLRTVVATVFVRTLKADREKASQIQRRLALSPGDAASQHRLREALTRHVPRTILAIDEAQILMPARSNTMARQALNSYVLEGRNFGLSLWLATQRPKGAVSDAAISQIDTFIVHRLSVSEDIKAVSGMLQSRSPDKIRLGRKQLDVGELIRALDVGQAVFSSATSTVPRFVVGEIRPRLVAHGGEAF